MFRFLPSGLVRLLVASQQLHSADCIAHRGDSLHHPDNSRQAIESAWEKDADILELDIRMTRDGVLVLFHDADLNDKAVSSMSHAQLDAADREKTVISLEQCLKEAEAGQRLLLDLKEHSTIYLQAVTKLVGESTPSGVEVMLQSTSLETLEALRELVPADMPLLYVTNLKPEPKAKDLAAELKKRNLQGITAKGRKFVDRDFVAAFQRQGLKYYVWTINPKDRIEYYVGIQVDGVITDDPALFREVVPREVEAPKKQLPFPGQSFRVDGYPAFVILPDKKAGEAIPWVWYAPTLPGLPTKKQEGWMFQQWLDQGIAIAGVDVGESYGSPAGRAGYQALYEELTSQRGFSAKPCLLARSRGGLMLYNWAVEHPEKVSGVAGIYPVCDLTSYPGLKKASGAYGMTEGELETKLAEHNPVSRLEPLAKAKVPLFHIHGDQDKLVPMDVNSGMMKERYEELGGVMTLRVIEGGGHDVKRHWFESQEMVDFVTFNLIGFGDDKELRQRILGYLDGESWMLEE